MVYKFFDKKSKGSGITNNNKIKQNIQLAEENFKILNFVVCLFMIKNT